MQVGKGGRLNEVESPIYRDLSLFKAIRHRTGKMFITHNDGGLSLVMRIRGLNSTSFEEANYEDIFSQISKTIEGIHDPGVSIQFVNCRMKNKKLAAAESLPDYLRPRAEYFNFLSENNFVFEDVFYLSVYIAPVKQSTKEVVRSFVSKLLNKETSEKIRRKNDAFSEADFRANQLSEIADRFFVTFKSLGFAPEFLESKEQVYNMIQDFTRPLKSKDEYIKFDDSQEQARQTMFSGVRATVNLDDFVLDDVYHRVYTLDRPPKEIITGATFRGFKKMNVEYLYSVTFRVMPHKEAISTFNNKARDKMVMADAAGHGSQIPDLVSQESINRVMESYERFVKGEGTGVKASMNLVVRIPQKEIEADIRKKGISFGEWKRTLDHHLINNLFPNMGRSEWAVENYTGWIVFNKCIPGFGHLNSIVLKETMLMAENIPYFFNLWSNRQNIEHNGVNHMFDEEGGFVPFDLMDPMLPAWNYNFSGETGSGKSVLVNVILAMQLAEMHGKKKPVISLIDVGGDRGSYYKLLELTNGERINLSRSKKPSIQILELIPELSMPTNSKIDNLVQVLKSYGVNLKDDLLFRKIRDFYAEKIDKGQDLNDQMLDKLCREFLNVPLDENLKEALTLKPGECQPDGKALSLILSVIEVMISSSPKEIDGFKLHQISDVLEIIKETYDRKRDGFPYMSDLYNTAKDLLDENDSSGRLMLTQLEAWTVRGSYGMFDADTSVDLTNDVILVDLKGLESEPQLQSIYTLVFNNLFSNKMYKIRGRRKLIVRDEAWSVMRSEMARRYLVEDLRTARKAGFATLTISQFPTDFMNPSPEDGRAILGNTQVFMIGKIANQDIIDQVTRTLNLPAKISRELKYLGNIKDESTGKTMYSRFLMKAGDTYYILRNVLHPFEYMLYSSSENDNLIIDYYKHVTKRFDSLIETLEFIAKGKHFGDKGLAKFLEESGASTLAKEILNGRP